MQEPEPGTTAAAEALVAAEQMKARSITASLRPLWHDLVVSVLMGGALALTLLPIAVGGAVAAGLFCLAMLLEVVQYRRNRVRVRQVLDERSVGASALFYLPLALVVPAMSLLRMSGLTAEPWVLVACWVGAAAAIFSYARLTQRYQARRLRTGDHGRYDVL
jgi:hypothetical protein